MMHLDAFITVLKLFMSIIFDIISEISLEFK